MTKDEKNAECKNAEHATAEEVAAVVVCSHANACSDKVAVGFLVADSHDFQFAVDSLF